MATATVSDSVQTATGEFRHAVEELYRDAAALSEKALDSEPVREVGDTIREAITTARRGLRAAGDVCQETAHCIEHRPFQAIAVTFVSALLIGFAMGRSSLKRRTTEQQA